MFKIHMYQSHDKLRVFLARGIVLSLLLLTTGFLFWSSTVLAAPLTYISDTTTASLTSPAINFTIKSGSVADSFTVNATSVVVTLSASTGGSFILISALRDLSISTSNAGGAAALTCNSSQVAQAVITQSTGSSSYTITPTATLCTPPPPLTSNLIGGYFYSPNPAISLPTVATSVSVLTTTSTPTVATSALVLTTTSTPQLLVTPTNLSPVAFNRNLFIGRKGHDVISLQLFLINQASGLAARKLAKVGATGFFGPLTRMALIEFQKKVGIKPAIGYFGPKTRAYINFHP